jgi:DNA (cytosine-5)-methyltransferase 1
VVNDREHRFWALQGSKLGSVRAILRSYGQRASGAPSRRKDGHLTVAEYFAGIGLVRMGLEPLGWRVEFANDFAPKKHAMYQSFFPASDGHYLVDDIFAIDPQSVPKTTLATCSFPCIDLSLAGNMNGMNGEHSSAFWGFVRVLRAQGKEAPPLVLVENVPGWLSSNAGKDFRLTVQALNKLGYACDVFVLDALRFTPQSRQRVFVVGARLETNEGAIDSILGRSEALLSSRLRMTLKANRDLAWFYNDLPKPPPLKKGGLSDITEQIDEKDPRWWSDAEVARHLAMMKAEHRAYVKCLARSGDIAYRTFFRRRRDDTQRAEVRHDDLAGCLRTAVGGSGKQFLIRVEGERIRMRAMTPREYARLQGVPDSFPITVNGVQALTGFGDAVCVPVINWIARHALNPLAVRAIGRYAR